jgi:HEPN domain-containing protein
MKKSTIKKLFTEAEEDLEHAKKELYRPKEDVVNFSACVFSRRALHKYLLGLSLVNADENDDEIQESNSLEKLIDYNGKYNEDLKNVDFSKLNCKCHDISSEAEEDMVYCDSVNKVSYCFHLSESVRKILIEKKPSLLSE